MSRFVCMRCAEEMTLDARLAAAWCATCERHYDTWVRQHAADMIWQTGAGAVVAMAIALPMLVIAPAVATLGVVAGFATFLGLRGWGKRRRRQQFLGSALPRAYLTSKS